jgi:hypothetical protein
VRELHDFSPKTAVRRAILSHRPPGLHSYMSRLAARSHRLFGRRRYPSRPAARLWPHSELFQDHLIPGIIDVGPILDMMSNRGQAARQD